MLRSQKSYARERSQARAGVAAEVGAWHSPGVALAGSLEPFSTLEHEILIEDVSLLDEILAEAQIRQSDPSYGQSRRAIEALVTSLLRDGARVEDVDHVLVDVMIADIDDRVRKHVNDVLHHPEFQNVEVAWRGLRFLVDRIDFNENILLEVLSCSRDELVRDFEDSPDVPGSGLYRIVYSKEYGTFGGKPYGLILANWEFNNHPEDLRLLRCCASVAAMAHAIFISNASSRFFGLESFRSLPNAGDLEALMDGMQYTAWKDLRESDDARYVGLCLPRFLLRLPYRDAVSRLGTMAFDEDSEGRHDRYLWAPASLALATRFADSFARYRWCPNITGPNAGGAVRDLISDEFSVLGRLQGKVCTEAVITDRREHELSTLGFISLVARRPERDACFFSANSIQKLQRFPDTEEGRKAETNFRLGAQLPYMSIITRLAHFVKVKEREMIGGSRIVSDIQRDLNQWIGQYVADMDDPAPEIRAQKPLRSARIDVEEVHEAGWYRCRISVQPHFRYMAATFTLQLVGKLDKARN